MMHAITIPATAPPVMAPMVEALTTVEKKHATLSPLQTPQKSNNDVMF
jgi:hypothetical protein